MKILISAAEASSDRHGAMLLKQIKLAAEAKGLTEKVKAIVEKKGQTLDDMTKGVATAAWKWLSAQPDLEPGSNG